MNAKGGGQKMLRGVAESKRKKEGKGHANGPSLELGLGRFGSG